MDEIKDIRKVTVKKMSGDIVQGDKNISLTLQVNCTNSPDMDLSKVIVECLSSATCYQRKESGRIESELLWVVLGGGSMSWLFATWANYVSSFDGLKSMVLGMPAIILWSFTVLLVMYIYFKQKRLDADQSC